MNFVPATPSKFPGEAVLITGAAKRVGRDIALYLAQAGYDIALHYYTSEAEAKATQREIEALGRRCELLQVDLADLSALPGLVRDAFDALPGLRHLVNNASVFDRGLLMESDAELMHHQLRVNFEAPAMLTQAFVSQVKEAASVTNILDTKIRKNSHSYFFYLLSKKSLAEFTRMAAAELGPRVRVNGVSPGVVMPSSDGVWGEEHMRDVAAANPLKATATPQDVAKAVHYVMTAPYLTGQILNVDGGESVA